MSKYLSCAETAKLVRKALAESFPGVKFSVKSHVYSGGASINVGWTDGPNGKQVEAVADTFCGGYFDGSIDYQGYVHHMIAGEQVSFGAKFIFCNRHHSDAAIERAIAAVCLEYAGNIKHGAPVPSLAAYKNGDLFSVGPMGPDHHWSWQSIIGRRLGKVSDRLAVAPSPTAGTVIFLGSDNYGQNAPRLDAESLGDA